MAWQRKIPFGYQMRNGEIELNIQEAETVRDIFNRYLVGDSYLTIAEGLTAHGPRYHAHTSTWNKNMVKRILENTKYIGADGYPRIVSNEDFLAVRLQKTDRSTYTPCPDFVEPVREKLVCGVCGAKITREAKSHGRTRWCCQNPDCGYTTSLDDATLRDLVDEQLQNLANSPHLLTAPPLEETSPSMDAVRLQNELTLALNRNYESPEYIKALALAAAAQRYKQYPDLTPANTLNRLRRQLEQGPANADTLTGLLNTAVQAVHLMPDRSVTLALVNGKTSENREDEIS